MKRRLLYHEITIYILVMILAAVVGHYSVSQARKNAEIKQLQAQLTKSYHVWVMSESCSSQLTNSADGILRIKLTK